MDPVLNVYHLERTDKVSYDQMRGAVVIAASVVRARELAAECAGSERWACWVSPSVRVSLIGVAVPGQGSRVVSTDRV
jgi:hypothetical protein